MIAELNDTLFQSEEVKRQTVVKRESADELRTALTAAVSAQAIPVKLEANAGATLKDSVGIESRSEYTSKKVELLHRNIMRYKQLFQNMAGSLMARHSCYSMTSTTFAAVTKLKSSTTSTESRSAPISGSRSARSGTDPAGVLAIHLTA